MTPKAGDAAVHVVLVTFEPDMARLRAVLDALLAQGCPVLLIDNASSDVADLAADLAALVAAGGDRVHATWNDRNVGLAAAQNQGIAQARAAGASHVLLLDQDTILPGGAVPALLAVSHGLTAQGRRVAAIGPAYRDRSSGERSLVWHHDGWRLRRTETSETVEVDGTAHEIARGDFIIASGSLIALDIIDAVGPMEDALFIDLIDIEWGLRAGAAGYESYQLRSLEADHAIGLGRIRVGPFSAPLHGPVRNYYWVRNALRLARRPAIPKAWRLYFARRAVSYVGFYTLFGDSRRARLNHLLRGLRDGLRPLTTLGTKGA